MFPVPLRYPTLLVNAEIINVVFKLYLKNFNLLWLVISVGVEKRLHETAHMWKPGDNFEKLNLSFHLGILGFWDSGFWSQAGRLVFQAPLPAEPPPSPESMVFFEKKLHCCLGGSEYFSGTSCVFDQPGVCTCSLVIVLRGPQKDFSLPRPSFLFCFESVSPVSLVSFELTV